MSITAPPAMSPVTFDGCFGWLHTPAGPGGRDTATVLCTGLRRDASNAHRPFRMLADQLAASGYPTLRFDYLGTGDSYDAERREHWAAWQQNIAAAADHVLAGTGARHVVLIGLRAGAALAALAAASRPDVAGLVLLDPVLRGKPYVTQLLVEARLRNGSQTGEGGGLMLDELCLSAETLRLMGQVDLRQMTPPPGCAVAIFSHTLSSSVAACIEAWTGCGVPVARENFQGLEQLLRPAHLADEPISEFLPILSWLRRTLPASCRHHRAAAAPKPVVLRPAGCVETPLHFGEHRQLFGMLCRPDNGRPDNGGEARQAVVIGNPGGDPHHGYARFSVEFARYLAARGIASLRMDFAGLGDSIDISDASGEAVGQVFEVDRNADFSAAFDALARLGYRRFAVHGLCSGAYHAFHAGLADPRISALLLINLPWFTLRHEKAAPNSFARRGMAELAHREVALFLLFAAGDAGLRPLEQHFGPSGIELSSMPNVAVAVVPGLDHDLTGRAMRQDAADWMMAFLLRDHRSAADVPAHRASGHPASGHVASRHRASGHGFNTVPGQPDQAALRATLIP
jgi:pimeloyl-ACP methyl ester carboxylesterase